MSFTYNFTTDPLLSTVRLMIGDTDILHPLFNDAEVNQALFIESSQNLYASGQAAPTGAFVQSPSVPQVYSPYRAAALLLDSLASNKALLSSVVQLLDVKLDVSKAATALKAQADSYREIEANAGHFAIAEWVVNQFTARERIWAQLLRLYGG